MKNYIAIILTFALGLMPMASMAQMGEDFSIRPPTISELEEKIQQIDVAIEQARKIALPAPVKAQEVEKKEEVQEILSREQVIDSVLSKEAKTKTMDLDFEETNLENILQTVSTAAGINVVVDPSLKNKPMSLHLKQVKIAEILHIVADSFNLAFKKIGGSLFITSKERIRDEHMTTRLIQLKNIKASEIKAMSNKLLDTINVSEDTNSLVVVGTPDEIQQIEALVKKVDVAQPQVVLEARIIEINKDALKDLGVDWSDMLSAGFQESGRPAVFSNEEDASGGTLRLSALNRSALQFEAVLKMLENDNKARILSNPRIITLNNKEAEIFVGDRIPYTVTTVTGGVATTEVRFVEPGIRLKVTPSIIDKDFVVIKIEPEVSFIFSFRGPDDQYPWVKTRNATANVRIGHNQPFVLGGLLNQEEKKNFYKVPMLGDMPLLGNLFSYQKHTIVDSELIITVVPVIINQ